MNDNKSSSKEMIDWKHFERKTCKCKDTLSVMIKGRPYCNKCNKLQVD